MPTRKAQSRRYIDLLRGINVGGRNKLPMRNLATIYESAGAENVRTYIQSGNVIYDATTKTLKQLKTAVIDAIEARFGFRPPIITLDPRVLRNVLVAQPFADADTSHLYVAFLDALPKRENAAALSNERSPEDQFEIIGREVYLHLPNGAARTQLTTNHLDKVLETTSTIRNWKTVTTLAQLAAG